jgi:hypothetical protein
VGLEALLPGSSKHFSRHPLRLLNNLETHENYGKNVLKLKYVSHIFLLLLETFFALINIKATDHSGRAV